MANHRSGNQILPFDRSLSLAEAAYRSCDRLYDAVDAALAARLRPLLLGGECSLIAGSLAAAIEQITRGSSEL